MSLARSSGPSWTINEHLKHLDVPAARISCRRLAHELCWLHTGPYPLMEEWWDTGMSGDVEDQLTLGCGPGADTHFQLSRQCKAPGR
jgi:hypothetical protein